jgi:hypothetical protein
MVISKLMRVACCVVISLCGVYEVQPVVTAQQVDQYFNSIDPDTIKDINDWLNELKDQDTELAQIIKENSLIKDITPLMIVQQFCNQKWLPVLFKIQSKGMDVVRCIHQRVVQRTQSINEGSHAGSLGDAIKDLAAILGYAREEDFNNELRNSYALKTLFFSPIDTLGNSALNYALAYNDQKFVAILRFFNGEATNHEFRLD